MLPAYKEIDDEMQVTLDNLPNQQSSSNSQDNFQQQFHIKKSETKITGYYGNEKLFEKDLTPQDPQQQSNVPDQQNFDHAENIIGQDYQIQPEVRNRNTRANRLQQQQVLNSYVPNQQNLDQVHAEDIIAQNDQRNAQPDEPGVRLRNIRANKSKQIENRKLGNALSHLTIHFKLQQLCKNSKKIKKIVKKKGGVSNYLKTKNILDHRSGTLYDLSYNIRKAYVNGCNFNQFPIDYDLVDDGIKRFWDKKQAQLLKPPRLSLQMLRNIVQKYNQKLYKDASEEAMRLFQALNNEIKEIKSVCGQCGSHFD